MNFLYLLTQHQLRKSTGEYDAQAQLIQEFLGLDKRPEGFLVGDDETHLAARTLARLTRDLFSQPPQPFPWMIEEEGIEWLSTVALIQQLFITLHEYGHAKEAWVEDGTPAVQGLVLRGLSSSSDDQETEDAQTHGLRKYSKKVFA